jgi:hypothetical protein
MESFMKTSNHTTSSIAALVAIGLFSTLSAYSVEPAMSPGMAMPMKSAKMPAHAEHAMPTSAADYNAEASKYDREAADLDLQVAKHANMAGRYRRLATGGSKRGTASMSIANHCERLAESYRKAAMDTRATAQSLRDMAKLG